MYQTNPRFQSETIRHASLQNPQQANPSLQRQQPPSTTEPGQAQPSQGLTFQQAPPVGDLAAQLADLEARQSSLEAQQAQATQAQPTNPSPTAQRFSPTMQPSTGSQPSVQPQQQPQPIQQPQQLAGPQLQQPQPLPYASPQHQRSQVRGIPGRLRSMVGIPMFGQGQQSQQGQPQVHPGMQQQGLQGSMLQPQGGQMGGPGQQTVRQPPVDILDEGDDIVLEIELPGARKEDIRLTGQQNAIQLNAPTRPRREKENLLQSERGQILYQRSIPLGIEIDSEKIEATFEDGVLRVKAPKRDPSSGPQRIEVN